MLSDTYKAVKRALKTRNGQPLKKQKHEDYPLIDEQIDYMNRQVQWEGLPQYKKFLKLESSKAYRDELVLTFLLFIAKTMNITKLNHVFIAPHTETVYHWMQLFKYTAYSVVTLIYRKKWTHAELFFLDEAVIGLNQGKDECLRTFFEKIGLMEPASNRFDSEQYFKYNRLLTSDVYGPFYWQMLHLMAEAFEEREGEGFAKDLWRQFVVYSMHRTLRCSICQYHYSQLVTRRKEELLQSQKYVKLWFEVHNEVNRMLQKPEYLESQFEADRGIRKGMLNLAK